MEKIYILQMHTNTIPSKIVKLFTKYEYSHIAISLDKSCDKIYSFGRRKLYFALNGGFVVQHKTDKFFKKYKETKCRIYELEISDAKFLKIQNVLEEMELKKEQYNYDFLGAFLRFFKIPVSFKNKYVCSFFVAELLESAKVYKFDKNVCFVVPKDFENINNIHQMYIGKYLDYNKEK